MRIFKDLEMVEQLGSGIPRILKYYTKKNFIFMEHFLRMVFPVNKPVYETSPIITLQDTPQVTPQVKSLLLAMKGELNRQELQKKLNLSDRENFRVNYLLPALESDLIEMTIPEKPKNSLQKYRLTAKGEELKKKNIK